MNVVGQHGSTFNIEVDPKGNVTAVRLAAPQAVAVPSEVPGYGGMSLPNGEVLLDLLEGPMEHNDALALLKEDEVVWSRHAQHAQLLASWEHLAFAKTDITVGDVVGWLTEVNLREDALGQPWSTWSLMLDDLGLIDVLRSHTHGGLGQSGLGDVAQLWLTLAQKIHDDERITVEGHLLTVRLDSGMELCFDTTLAEHCTLGRTWTLLHTPEHHVIALHPEAKNALGPSAVLWEPWWGQTLPLSRVADAAWARLIEDELVGTIPDADWACWYPKLWTALLNLLDDEPTLWARLNLIRSDLEGA